jgi:hypothetical protein
VAAIGLFSKNAVGVFYTLSWWAICYFPGGWARRVYALPPVGAAARAARVALRATTVVHRVDAAVRLHPGVVAAPIILGTLAGCGGRLLVDAFSHCAGYRQGGCSFDNYTALSRLAACFVSPGAAVKLPPARVSLPSNCPAMPIPTSSQIPF